jgi:hypothetical protein
MMGAKFISSRQPPAVGGAVDIPGFQSFGEDLINVTRASAAMWLTLVTDAQRPAFEAAALAVAARTDPSGALARQVATDGIRVRRATATGAATRSYESAPLQGQYVAGTAALHPRGAPVLRCFWVCVCARTKRTSCWPRSDACRRVSLPAALPAWATAPRSIPRLGDLFLYDAFNEPLRRAALLKAMDTSLPAMTDLLPNTVIDPLDSLNPAAIVFAPTWNHAVNDSYGVSFAPNATTTLNPDVDHAFCAIAFHWTTVRAREKTPLLALCLRTESDQLAQVLEDSLPRFTDDIIAVLQSPSGKTHTFSVSGREVISVGPGDQHVELVQQGLAAEARRLDVTMAGAAWSITLFPTAQARPRHARLRA